MRHLAAVRVSPGLLTVVVLSLLQAAPQQVLPGESAVASKRQPAQQNPVRVFHGQLTKDDPPDPVFRDGLHHRIQQVPLVAGTHYQIDLESKDFDTFLRLEDAAGKQLDQNDDSGGSWNSRLLFTPRQSGTFRFIVTATLGRKTVGAYSLSIRRIGAADMAEKQKQRQAERRVQAINEQVSEFHDKGRRGDALPLARKAVVFGQKLGEHHPDFATAVHNLAKLHHKMRHYEEALLVYKKALQILGPLGEDHTDYTSILNNLAFLYHDMDRDEEAVPLLQKALLIHRKLGEHHAGFVTVQRNLARLYQSLGRYEEALPLYTKVVQLRRQLGGNNPYYASSLSELARLYQDLDRHEDARLHYHKALQIQQKLGNNQSDYVITLNGLAEVYQDQGRYDEALPLIQEALQASKKLADDLSYARSLSVLAAQYLHTGHYERALPLYRDALQIAQKWGGEQQPEFASLLNNLAIAYRYMGSFEQALPLCHKAVRIYRKLGEGTPLYATSLHNLASVYLGMGQYEQALPLLEESLKIRRKRGGSSAYAVCLLTLGDCYCHTGRYEAALPLYKDASELFQELGKNNPRYAVSLNNLAIAYDQIGRKDQARVLLQQALELDKRLGEHHPAYANTLNNLGMLYESMGRYDEALTAYQDALKIYQQVSKADLRYGTLLANLGGFYLSRKQPGKAVDWLQKALNFQQKSFDATFSVLNQQQRLRLIERERVNFYAYLNAARQASMPTSQMYQQILVWKGTVAARQSEELAALDQPQVRPLVEKVGMKRASLAKLYQATPATLEDQAAWQKRFKQIETELEDLERELSRKSEPFRRFREIQNATARDVSAGLPDKTALLDFLFCTEPIPDPKRKHAWKHDRHLLAFVLAPGREPALVDLGPAEPTRKLLTQWRRAVENGDGMEEVRVFGQKLREILWQPLLPHLAGIDTVLIAPDAELCQLPFAVLPGSKKGTYLLEEYAIGYVLSGRQLLELKADDKRPRSAGLLVAGGLQYGLPTKLQALARGKDGEDWPELPSTLLEAERIHRQFRSSFPSGPARLLTKKQLDGPGFAALFLPGKTAQRYQYLHLATHGQFEPPPKTSRPSEMASLSPLQLQREVVVYKAHPLMRSSLVFAGANLDPERGILTAQEIASLDLRGLDLAVLSACETGLGTLQGGEGVQGLQQAFHQAGCRSLVASLWQIDDAATSVLMERFYQNLWQKKMSKLEALRQAQLTVLRNRGLVEQRRKELQAEWTQRAIGKGRTVRLPQGPGVERSHPALWAAFVLSGDTR